jgi:Rnl2 family RNA ligase
VFEVFALYKADGSSAHISFHGKDLSLSYFPGAAKLEHFKTLFNEEDLLNKFRELFQHERIDKVTVYGEVYGGKIQGNSKKYGPNIRFTAFDVKVETDYNKVFWMDVPKAEEIVKGLGLDFMPYNRGPLTLGWLNEQRALPSRLAIVSDAKSEGIVIRPIHELTFNGGGRWIIKYKNEEFRETKSKREVTPEKQEVLSNAQEIASDFVTEERLRHVLDKTPYHGPESTGPIIKAMVADIKLESEGEVEWSKEVEKAISRNTAQLLKDTYNKIIV